MSALSKVTTGKVKKPYYILLYGPDGVGKTTFGAEAPKPIFLGTESGTDQLDVARFPVAESWGEVLTNIEALTKEEHDYKTVVLDSLDWLEPLLHKYIMSQHNATSMARAAGGFGKAYEEAANHFKGLDNKLKKLRNERDMNVILIAHADVIKFNDPQQQEGYDRYELKLHKKASPIFRESVDAVLFANYEQFTSEKDEKIKIIADGSRVIYTERRPGFDAKNRFGLPFEFPLNFELFDNYARNGNPDKAEEIIKRINGMLPDVKDDVLLKQVQETVEKLKMNPNALLDVEQRLITRLSQS